MRICEIEGCTAETRTPGQALCGRHYRRKQRHGDPNVLLRPAPDLRPPHERWKTSYVVDTQTECWNWTGPKSRGYGFITEGAKKRYAAHRFVYEQVIGPIPDGLTLDHKCRNTGCVNPRHLEPVSHALNVQRGDAGINNAIKTHCKHGHGFTPENTIVTKSGHRACRECQRRAVREATRKRRAAEYAARPPRTHCKHGHKLTPENTFYGRGGGKGCRICSSHGGRKRQGLA